MTDIFGRIYDGDSNSRNPSSRSSVGLAVRNGRESPTKMSWNSNAPLHFKLGTIAIYNRLTKRTVDLRDGVLAQLQDAAPALYKDLVEAPCPATAETK